MPLRIPSSARTLVLTLSIAGLSTACGEQQTDAERLEAARSSLSVNETREAIIHIKNVLKNQPERIEAKLLLAKAYKQLGDYASAENELRVAIDLGADESTTTLLIVDALAQQQKFEELVKIDAKVVDEISRSVILTEQAKAFIALNEPEQAINAIEKAVTLDPASAEANTTQAAIISIEDLDSARELAQRITEQHPDYAPAYSLLGRIERTQDNLAGAEAAFSSALNLKETFQDYFFRAMIRIALNNTDGAQLDIDNARRFLPQYFELDYAQGLLDYRRGDLEGARTALQEAYSANNTFPPTLFYLAAVNFNLGFLEESESMAYNYVFMNPDYLPGTRLLADIYLRRGKYPQAEEVIRPAADTHTKDIGVLSQLSDSLRGQSKRQQELAILEQMDALEPDNKAVSYRIGSALLALNKDTARGVQLLNESLSSSPTHFGSANDLVAYYSKNQRHQEAIELAKQFLTDSTADNPKNTQAYNLLGLAYASAGDITSAKAIFEQALKQVSADPVTNNNLATLAIQSKDFKAARQRLNTVIDGYGPEYSTLIKLAALDRFESRWDEMVAHLEQAQSLKPENPDPAVALTNYYLQQGMPAKAQQAFGLLAVKFSDNPNILALAGRVQLATGDAERALESFTALTNLLPQSAQSHFLLSQGYAANQNLNATLKELNKALRLDPNHFSARLNLAQLLYQQGKTEESRLELEKLKKAAPTSPDLAYLEGLIARKSGDMDEALDYFKKVLESTENTKSTLAVAQQEWDSNQQDLAIARIENWLKDHQDDVPARLYLAKFYSATHRAKDSAAQYEQILSQDPSHLVALNNLAWEIRSSEPARAVEYAQKAFDLANGNADIADTLSVAQMHKGDYRLALRNSDAAIAKRTLENSPSMFYHRAQILAKMGKKAESMELLLQLMQPDIEFTEKADAKALLDSLQ